MSVQCDLEKLWNNGNRILLPSYLNPQYVIFPNENRNILINVFYYDYYYYHKKPVILEL